MKLSQALTKATKIPTQEDYAKMQDKYIRERLLGKRQHGMKKLMKDLYTK